MNEEDPTSPSTADVLVIELDREPALDMESAEGETNGGGDTATTATSTATAAALLEAPPPEIQTSPVDVSTFQPAAPAIQPRVLRRAVRGRYRSAGGPFVLELRVDIDGPRPMMKVSGDFYQVSGGTTSHYGSFRVDSPTVTTTPTTVTIEGVGAFTFTAGAPKLRVTIPRTTILQPAAPATAQFLTLANHPGASYLCRFASIYFRSVRYEQDCEVRVAPFVSYDTGSLPCPRPPTTLTVSRAFAEAGIELQSTGATNVVPVPSGSKWSNAELHDAMEAHFSLWKNDPQWAVWLLAAYEHEMGPGLYGIMFDQQGRHRQGCAVFHKGIGGNSAEKQRLQLYTYVHELGHCFNLLHSWQKSLATPPAPNRPGSLSWMNYPWYFPGGPGAFWSQFPFQFDGLEVTHLRHAFRQHVIMGGSPFSVGAALEAPEALENPIEDNSGIGLELRSKRSYALGEPVTVELKLEALDVRGKEVHASLHPDFGAVQVAIRKPSGRSIVFEPLIDHCADAEIVTLVPGEPALYASAYLGFGRGGLTFDEIGPYQIRALYAALDGSQVVSNIVTVWVRVPLTAEDQAVAELLLGEEQGTLFYLLGSDSRFLARGAEAMHEVLEAHGDHPLATYVRLVEGVNAARDFKTIVPGRPVSVRPSDVDESRRLLGAVLQPESVVDNITRTEATRALVRAHERAGDEGGADDAVQLLVASLQDRVGAPILRKVVAELRADGDAAS